MHCVSFLGVSDASALRQLQYLFLSQIGFPIYFYILILQKNISHINKDA